MNELNELMQNEFDTMAGMDVISERFKQAVEAVNKKLTREEYAEIEDDMIGGYCDGEKFAFEQGFMRGIAVAKGGAA